MATSIDPSSPVPLYAQIKEMLQQEIEAGMHPGDSLPAEPALEKRFGVSRITIRRALNELEAVGIIVRRQGRGTFVRKPRIKQELNQLISWTELMRGMGYEPRTVSSDTSVIEPSQEMRSMLRLNKGERVIRVRRLRWVNDEPICIMMNYLPESLVPDLIINGLVDDSLYATLAVHRIRPFHAEDVVEARSATEWEAKQLHVSPSSPLLQVTRLTYDEIGTPLYVAIVTSRADKYTYSIKFDAQ